jgi:hypothetical protein
MSLSSLGLKVHLESFIRDFLKRYFRSRKLFLYSTLQTSSELLIKLCHGLLKVIPPSPYEVYDTKELRRTLKRKPYYKDAVEDIITRLMSGLPVWPYQSSKISLLEHSDPLLAGWDIYHFHLSTEKDDKNPYFFKRTNDLLFAMRKGKYFLLLDILPHKWKSFIDTWLLEIAKKYWPEAVHTFRGNLAYAPKPKHHYDLVNRRYINIPHQKNSEVYIPLGVASEGTAGKAVMIANRLWRYVNDNKLAIKYEIGRQYEADFSVIAKDYIWQITFGNRSRIFFYLPIL